MNASGHQFHTNAARKNASGVPNRARAQPQTRAPLTSLRVHDRPSTGRLGCMLAGAPMRAVRASIPRKSRTAATSPKGTPVCAMPNGPGIHADEQDRRPGPRHAQVGAVRMPRVIERVVRERHRRAESQGRAAVSQVACDPFEPGVQRGARRHTSSRRPAYTRMSFWMSPVGTCDWYCQRTPPRSFRPGTSGSFMVHSSRASIRKFVKSAKSGVIQ